MESELKHALHLQELGRAAEAHAIFLKLVAEYPDDASVQLGMGLFHKQGGDYESALKHIDKCWELSRGNESVCELLIETLLLANRSDEAFLIGSEALKQFGFSSRTFDAILGLAKEIANGIHPSLPERNRIFRLFNQRWTITASEELLAALSAWPDWAEGWALRGAVAFLESPVRHGDSLDNESELVSTPRAKKIAALRQSLEHFDRALGLDPHQELAKTYKAKALFELDAELPLVLDWLPARMRARQKIQAVNYLSAKAYCERTQNRYIKVAEPEILQVPPPNYLGTSFVYEASIGSTASNELYFAEASEALVFSKHDVVLASNEYAIADKLSHPLGEVIDLSAEPLVLARSPTQLLIAREPRRAFKLERAAHLTGPSTHEFGHWFFDYLPRVEAFAQHPQFAAYPIVVDAGMPPTHSEALRLLIGSTHPVVEIPPNTELLVDNLLLAPCASFFPYQCKPGTPSSVHIAAAALSAIRYLREKLLLAVNDDEALPVPSGRGRRLFLARNSKFRRLTNQDEIQELLISKYGFEVLRCEDLNFTEQVRAFSQADVVLGPNGSAFSNVIFCPLGSKIVSLCQSQAGNFPSWAAALEHIGIHHLYVAGSPIAGSFWHEHHRDYCVPLSLVEQAMQQIGLDCG